MVIVELSGGLGNQLFQYAVSRCLALKLNTELKLDLSKAKVSLNPKGHVNYRLADFNIQENIATPEEVANVKATGLIAPPFPNPEGFQRDVFVWGHAFHSENAFIETDDIIRREFTLKNPLHRISAAWEKKILAAQNSVALHIRHGDYVDLVHITGLIPLDYYKICVAELKKFFPNLTAFIFSEDLDWARENLKLDVPMEFVQDCESDNEEFYLMSLCKHTVIANSTFSWWAAWLNPNPNKRVFAPLPWTRSGLWDNGIPASWTRVSVDYDNNPVDCPPLLSVIVYTRNNAANLGFMLSNVFNQTLRDYELLIIDDASADGSENIFRQIHVDKKVTLISSGSVIGKAAAWNKGLDYARGEYVLFLSGDEIIFSDTVHVLCQIYSSRKADIISSVQYLEENPEGDLGVANIQGKRFFRRIDKQFEALNVPQLFQDYNLRQKISMIGTQVFNTLTGTKFFRRAFLTKNSIRFNENITTDFELHFVTNAVMASKEIIFMPNLFLVTTGDKN